jgi:predicted nucleotidyltransferase
VPEPTPYPAVNAILGRLLAEVQAILGDDFVGLYLYGSLALGDFDPLTSDVDFLVVTSGELPAEQVTALGAMHARLADEASAAGVDLEGSYIPRQAIRRHSPTPLVHPHLERGGAFRLEEHHDDWIIQRHILVEHGVTVAGPPAASLIDPVGPAELRRAVLGIRWWWARQLADPTLVAQEGYQSYAVLTMCRMRYTLELGAIISKPAAARWAEQALEPRWAPLIEAAAAWRPGRPLDRLGETLAFIREALAASARWEP